MNYTSKICIFTVAILLFTTIRAHAELTSLPQDIDYSAWASSLIYSNNFSTDPTQPVTKNEEASAQLAIYLLTNSSCISSTDPITYRMLVHNTGNAPAKDLFISLQSPIHADILSSQRPANEYDDRLKTLVWQEPALIPNRSITYSFTVLPDEDLDRLLHNAVVEYLTDNTTQQAITNHVIEEKC